MILLILVSMAGFAQSAQNNKWAKSLCYLENEVRDKVDFCTDKHQSIQKVGSIISDGCSQACLTYSRSNVSKKLWVMRLILINMKSFCNLILYLSKVWSVKNLICLKYPEKFMIFLLYLKKEVRNAVDFLHAGKHQSFP